MNRLAFSLLVAAVLAVASPARAAWFVLDDYEVTLREYDPGLVVWAEDELIVPTGGLGFNLVQGQEKTVDLFTIGTDETSLNWDDAIPYPISVALSFSVPTPGFDGDVDGLTGSAWFGNTFGYVAWDNPLLWEFGNYGLLAITLSHETFALPGEAMVQATFKLLKEDGGYTKVPEPASALLVGIGLAALAARGRRVSSGQVSA